MIMNESHKYLAPICNNDPVTVCTKYATKIMSNALFYKKNCRQNQHLALQMMFVVIWGGLMKYETEK